MKKNPLFLSHRQASAHHKLDSIASSKKSIIIIENRIIKLHFEAFPYTHNPVIQFGIVVVQATV
jgi:hypothetical protein